MGCVGACTPVRLARAQDTLTRLRPPPPRHLSSTLLFLEKCLQHRASLTTWLDRFADANGLQQWGALANEDLIGRMAGEGAGGRWLVCVRVYAHMCTHHPSRCQQC